MQMHVALTTAHFDESIEFYTRLLGVPPTKRQGGFATFRPPAPAVRLSLMAGPAPEIAMGEHYGIFVPDSDTLKQTWDRLAEAGLTGREEAAIACCMAVQDKLWLTDPDGRPWEIYTVLDDTTKEAGPQANGCCSGVGAAKEPQGCCP